MKIVDKMGVFVVVLDVLKVMLVLFMGIVEEMKELVAGVADAYGIFILEEFGYEVMYDDEGF